MSGPEAFAEWARRYPEAAAELRSITIPPSQPRSTTPEGAIQTAIRLEAARQGWQLWRNNKGVLRDNRGIPVRFGLANDSKKLSDRLASADLIGTDPYGRFASVEVKRPGGTVTQAQINWCNLVNARGGVGLILDDPGGLKL